MNKIIITENQLVGIIKGGEIRKSDSVCDADTIWNYEKKIVESYGLPGVRRYMLWKKEQDLQCEGLIRSYDYKILCERLKQIGLNVININLQNKTPVVYVLIPTEIDRLTIDKYQQLLTKCGWYETNAVSTMHLITPKFGADADNAVYVKNHGIIYHTTPSFNSIKISKQGLVPKSKHKIDNSQDIVHFFFSSQECEWLAPSLSSCDDNHSKTYTIYKIDLNLIPKGNVKPRFFNDPQHPDAVITMENIPPFCIFKIKDFDINP